MGYSLTLQAKADFDHIYDTGLREFGATQGDAYAAGFAKIFEFLAEFPRAARERMELSPPVRAFPYKSHVVIYEIADDDIVIVRLRHSREDWLANLS